MEHMDLRVVKTVDGIEESFLDCLKEVGFPSMTVKIITERARINRSTFYKHYADKYDLRDKYVDKIIKDFVKNLDVAFVHLKEFTVDSYYGDLRHCLEAFMEKREEYLVLWDDMLLGRNVFEEMIDGGVDKLVHEFEKNPDIPKDKKCLFALYARLFLGNMMVSVRWWFKEGMDVDVDYFTKIMILHMTKGIFPTLKNENII